MTTIELSPTNQRRLLEGGQNLLAQLAKLPQSAVPDVRSPLTKEEEFYLASGLRWVALKLQTLTQPNCASEVRALLQVFESAFNCDGCKLPDPSASNSELSKGAANFDKARTQIISSAQPHLAAIEANHTGKVRYFNLNGVLQNTTDNGGAPDETIEKLKGYAKRLIARISNQNFELIEKIIKKWRNHSPDSIFSAAIPGLVDGLTRFQPERGLRISTFVSSWIKQEVSRTLHYENHPIHYPQRIELDLRAFRKLARASGGQAKNLDFSNPKIGAQFAKLRKLSDEKLANQLALIKAANSAKVGRGERTDKDRETIAFDPADGRIPPVWEQIASTELQEIITERLGFLPERASKILELRFGLNGNEPKTLDEVAAVFGITKERVRQIQEKTLQTLRKTLKPIEV